MRDILFRGKRVDNGKWVEGYYTELPCGSLGATIFSNDDELVCEDTKSYIIKVFTKQHTNYSNSNPLQVIECEKHEVIPETVGQFTGLCDKNGRKIFEGDIVESPNGTQGFIEWQNAECAFLVDIGDDWQTMDDCPYEVIGNKYDNKEEE
jgi:uncharacterized phage protein (TIGR01671 family)